MLRDFRTSDVLEFRKMLHTMCDAFDFVCKKRETLLEFNSSTSKYEIAQYERYFIPEEYYHYQLFDKEVCIIRNFNPREWTVEDPDKKYMHFSVACVGFVPREHHGLKFTLSSKHVHFGDWISIDDCLKTFHMFCNDLIYEVAHINVVEQHELEIF